MIEGINSVKLDLARNFFYENGEAGKYELLGMRSFLNPQLVQRITTIVIEMLSNRVFNDIGMVVAKSHDDLPLAYEIAKRLGIVVGYPYHTNGLYFFKEKFKNSEQIKVLIVSYSLDSEDGFEVDNLIDDPRIQISGYACIVKYDDPKTEKHRAPIYTLYTKDQMNQITDYYLSLDLKERKEKFVKAIK